MILPDFLLKFFKKVNVSTFISIDSLVKHEYRMLGFRIYITFADHEYTVSLLDCLRYTPKYKNKKGGLHKVGVVLLMYTVMDVVAI